MGTADRDRKLNRPSEVKHSKHPTAESVGARNPISVDPKIASPRCRRCRYDLRGLNRSGRCPECGLPVALSLASLHVDGPGKGSSERESERWEWMYTGAWWIGQSMWMVVPFILGAALIPTFAVVAPAGVAAHAIAHWFGVRDLTRGLAGLRFEEGDPVGAADLARRIAVVYAVSASAAFLGVFASCFASFVPGAAHVVLPGLALFPGIAAVILARRAGVELADALGMRERLPFERLGTITLWTAAGFWILAALTALVSAAVASLDIILVSTGALASVTLVVALLFHRDLFLRLALAIPQIEDFSAAADRATRKRPLIVPHARAQDIDLSPLKLEDGPETPRPRH